MLFNVNDSIGVPSGTVELLAPLAIGLFVGRPAIGVAGSALSAMVSESANALANEYSPVRIPLLGSSTKAKLDPVGVPWHGKDVPLLNGDRALTERFLSELGEPAWALNYSMVDPKRVLDLSVSLVPGTSQDRYLSAKFEGVSLPLYHIGLVMLSGESFCVAHMGEKYSLLQFETLLVSNYSKSGSIFANDLIEGRLGLLPTSTVLPFKLFSVLEELDVQIVWHPVSSTLNYPRVSFISEVVVNENEPCVVAGSQTSIYNIISDLSVSQYFEDIIATRAVNIVAPSLPLANAAWERLQQKYCGGSLVLHYRQYGMDRWSRTDKVVAEMTTYNSWWNWVCDGAIP